MCFIAPLSSSFHYIMGPWLFLCVGVATLNSVFAGLARERQGPYDILIRFVEDCSEGDVPIKVYPRMKRVNRSTLAVVGHFVNTIVIDESIKWSMQLDQKTPQGYKDKFYYTDFHKQSACLGLEEFGDENDFKRLFGAIKTEGAPYEGCPVDIGKHEFELSVLVEPFKKFPIFFYNTYRVTVKGYTDFESPPIGCIVIVVEVIPKKMKG